VGALALDQTISTSAQMTFKHGMLVVSFAGGASTVTVTLSDSFRVGEIGVVINNSTSNFNVTIRKGTTGNLICTYDTACMFTVTSDGRIWKLGGGN